LADLLVRHLQEKGKEHSALEMLVNQWGFDERLIPKALQTIGSLFPHYSRHDESHSKQILINIERLLGENIRLLTATDTWLLLEAAYWHDIGMVVPQTHLEEALTSDDFRQYVESIRNSPHHDLRSFCNNFDFRDMSRCFGGADTPIDAIDKFRQLMAEWFRKKHANRADGIVQSPWESVGIRSPRTELIPARLFRVLGRICQMHGASFSELLGEGGLAFREAGLAQEDCHPRFVACLLRMGDLLDLDDNRFCPVMQRIAGDNRPKISKAHEDKHSAMRHLRIDREYIEIEAECESIDGYVEAFKWFDWLKQEMQDQMANWQRIVPSRELGLLPTLGKVSVRLRGELQILSEGDRPQFTIDAERAKELLQGSNLYKDRYACVRELLQNAVDATLLRLWLSNNPKKDDVGWATPFSATARRILDNAAIRIELVEKKTAAVKGMSDWTLTITDEGTGISRTDLIHMLKIGGSQGNVERQKRIAGMPEWMKPSGVFGIGFQSAFLICDEVKIVTKSIFSGEVLSIVMHSPTKSKEGLVLLRRIDGDISQKCGTTITLDFSVNADEQPYIGTHRESAIARSIAFSFDPVLDEPVALSAARLADKIHEFGANSPVSVFGEMRTANEKHCVSINTDVASGDPIGNWRFLSLGEHQVKIRYRPVKHARTRSNKINFYYRGQKFEADLHVPCAQVEVDLMSGRAGNWLSASRDALAAKAVAAFNKLVLSSLATLVGEDLKRGHDCAWMKKDERPIFSFFLRAMARIYKNDVWDAFAEQLGDAWCDTLSPDETNTLRHYLKKDELILIVSSYGSARSNNGTPCLTLDSTAADLFLREWVKSPGNTVSVVAADEVNVSVGEFDKVYSLKSIEQVPYTNLGLAAHLLRLSQLTFANARYVLRLDGEKWSGLFLRDDVKVNARRIFDYIPETGGRVLLPLLYRARSHGVSSLVDVPSLDALCVWVKPKLISEISVDEIKQLYMDLISYLDNDIMKASPYWRRWVACRQISTNASRQKRSDA
jgi:hypothetical protein